MTLAEELATWASKLSLGEVPARVVAFAKSQVLSQLAAARAGASCPLGKKVIGAFGSPNAAGDPKRAAYVLAALTMCLDFDDTMYAGHTSHSTVNVPLAYAQELGLDGGSLLEAVIAADECAARVTAAATLGAFRGQTAAHTHLAGAVAGRLRAERAPAERWVSAWGIAFAMPPWSLVRAFMGSDAKVLTASTPLRVGLDSCDAARAGMAGAPEIFEDKEGFLSRFADVALPEAVSLALGERWHTETLSFKVWPGCAYIDAAIDCAAELNGELSPSELEDVTEVVVHGSIFTLGMDLRSARFVVDGDAPVSALNFSVGYNVATALLTGGLVAEDFFGDRVRDARRWELAHKVRLVHDGELTRRAVLATAPLGEALRQAGERAEPWIRQIGGEEAVSILAGAGSPVASFEDAEKAIGARLEVRLGNGRVLAAERQRAVGAAGPDTRNEHRELMKKKFVGVGGAPDDAEAILSLETLSAKELSEVLSSALR